MYCSEAAQAVSILATSREPLRSPGETTWRVPSLSLPPPVGVSATLEDVLGFESVRLFVDRAQAALPGFTVTPANSAAVQDICWRLDGIPLAIELAAARVRVFGIEQIAARLDDRFRLLTAGARTAMPRQQTLQATVDWSYALLSEAERTVLRRLAVFAGGWTLEAAEAVAAGHAIRRAPYSTCSRRWSTNRWWSASINADPCATGCWRPSVSMPANDSKKPARPRTRATAT